MGGGFDMNKPTAANFSSGFGFCSTAAETSPYRKYRTARHRTRLLTRSSHLLAITRPRTIWAGSKHYCTPIGTPVTVCTLNHRFRTGGGGQATYTPGGK